MITVTTIKRVQTHTHYLHRNTSPDAVGQLRYTTIATMIVIYYYLIMVPLEIDGRVYFIFYVSSIFRNNTTGRKAQH